MTSFMPRASPAEGGHGSRSRRGRRGDRGSRDDASTSERRGTTRREGVADGRQICQGPPCNGPRYYGTATRSSVQRPMWEQGVQGSRPGRFSRHRGWGAIRRHASLTIGRGWKIPSVSGAARAAQDPPSPVAPTAGRHPHVGRNKPRAEDLLVGSNLLSEGSRTSATTGTMVVMWCSSRARSTSSQTAQVRAG